MSTEKTNDKNEIPAEMRVKIVGLIRVVFPEAKIYLYGSRAKGTHHDRSDIDLAIDVGQRVDRMRVNEVRSILEATSIPYKIDLVDVHSVSESLRAIILREGVLWYSS